MAHRADVWQPRSLGPGALTLCGLFVFLVAILLPVSPQAALLPVLLAALLIPLVRSPRIAPAVVLFAVPLLSGMPRGELVPIFRPNELVLIFVFCAYLLALVLGPRQRIEFTFVDRAFLIFLLARAVLPLVAHPLASADPTRLAKFFMAPLQYYLLYRLILGTTRSREDLMLLLRVMVAGAVVVAVVGLLQAARVPQIEDLLRTYYPSNKTMYTFLHSRRVTSLFGGGWNACAFYLSQILLVAITLFRFERPGMGRALLVGAAVLVAGVMGLSFSFTTTITLLLALFYYGYRYGKIRVYLLRLVPVAIGFAVLIVTFFAHALRERMALQFRGTLIPITLLTRLSYWRDAAFPKLAGKLVFGIGPSRFDAVSAESEYVFIIANCGLVGLAGFFVFAAYAWRKLRALSRKTGVHTFAGSLSVLGMTLFLQNLVASTTAHYFEYSGSSELLWGVWAMTMVARRLPASGGASSSPTGAAVDRHRGGPLPESSG